MTRHFGVLIPSTNTTVETEYTTLLPASLQAHYARLGKVQDVAFSPSRNDDLAYQSKLLGNAKVEVIALTQTSASLFDENYDADAQRSMTDNAKAASITSAQAIGEALQALGATRVALVSPYSEDVIARAKRYYESRYGLEVVATEAFGATDSYAIGALGEENAAAAFTRINRPEIQALVVPGGNFPTMKFVAGWEQELGKPVITTNQAVVWGVLAKMGVREPLPGLGASFLVAAI